jgi:C4-dicarboxylate transporter DctM subunit
MIISLTLFLGLILLAILGYPLAFAIAIPSAVITFLLDVPMVTLITMMFSGIDSFALMAIPFFILAGSIMDEAGITQRIIDLANILVGRLRGGLGQVNIVSSMILSGIQGSGVADASAIGSLTIPAMLKQGYHKDFAVCVTACAATMGPIIPPSISMILYAFYTNMSVGSLFLGGAIPGILIGLGLMGVCYLVSVRRGYLFGTTRYSLWDLLIATKRALTALFMPFIIIGGIVTGIFTATESGIIAVLYGLGYGFLISRSLRVRRLPKLLLESAVTTSIVLFIISVSTVFGNLLSRVRFQQFLIDGLGYIQQPTLQVLAIMVILLILGCFIDPVVLLVMFSVPITAIGVKLGYHPVHFGVWFVIVTLYGAVTPPVGTMLYVALSIANAKMDETYRLLPPFLAVLIALVLAVLFIPELTLWLPRRMGLL